MRRWLVAAVLVLLATSVQAQVSPVGLWSFDEGTGLVAADSSGEANDGSITGATWIGGAQGPHALRFDGNDTVYMGDRESLEPTTLTVAMCIRSAVPPPGAYTILVSEGLEGCACASYAWYVEAQNNLAFYTCSGTEAYATPLIPSADVWNGRWHRIVATFDGSFVRGYLDGEQVGAPVAGVAPNYALSTHSDFRVGLLGACSVSGFAGDIDDLGVWDGALSDLEIAALSDCNDLLLDGFETGDTSSWSSTVQ